MKKYPKAPPEEEMERVTQTDAHGICDACSVPSSLPVSPILPVPQVSFHLLHDRHDNSKGDAVERFMVGLTPDVEISFTERDFKSPSPSGVLINHEEESFIPGDDTAQDMVADHRGILCSPFVASASDVHDMCLLLNQRISEVDRQLASSKAQENLFDKDTENLHGEFEKDLEKYLDRPILKSLLLKYKDIFGPLPPPGSGCQLVQMDLELKEELK